MEDRTFPSNEAEEEIVREAFEMLRMRSIGFIKLESRDGSEDGLPAGTATLASINNIRGFLTAAHVIENLPTSGSVGIVQFKNRPEQIQRTIIDMKLTDRIVIRDRQSTAGGPDIGFIRIPEYFADRLSASINVFVNIDRFRARALGENEIVPFFHALVGVISEWTETEIAVNAVRKTINGIVSLGQIKKIGIIAESFDLIEFEIGLGEDTILPNSYEGTSGGALWRVNLSDVDGSILEVKPIGVAFYQSEKIDGRRTIVCSGPRTIYQRLADQVRSKWSR